MSMATYELKIVMCIKEFFANRLYRSIWLLLILVCLDIWD